jgi:hypothetical protein
MKLYVAFFWRTQRARLEAHRCTPEHACNRL